MLLSIIIVTWNSEAYIRNCLFSLGQEIQGWELEVIVVDNASSDKTLKILKKEFPKVRLIVNAQNFGFARAVNQGIKFSRGEYLLLLNPDTIICPGALKSMVQFMESNLKVGVVGPQLISPRGEIQPSCREFPSYSTLLFEFLGLSRLFPRHRVWGKWRMGYFNHKTKREVDQPMGACLLLRKKTIEEVGLLDEKFGMFFNEVDLCLRVKRAGWKIFFFPDSKVIHYGGKSTELVKTKMIWSSHRSMYYFFQKNRKNRVDFFLLPLFAFLLIASAFTRIAFRLLSFSSRK